ncbi:MAG: signal peptidase I [Syntrophobacterales bacterium]|jgi:conjugal transfer pilin signal peptidase TrbI|nr:signal peptidase I [Syntrophobacterales bacterium]
MSWWRRLVKAKKPWPLFIAQCLAILAVAYVLGWWFSNLYEFGIAQGKPCMPGGVYFIERRVEGRMPPAFQRGDLIVFRTDKRTAPHYQPGTRFVKVVRGVPGDRVHIDPGGKVEITGEDYRFETALEPQVVELLVKGKTVNDEADFVADYAVPPGSYFAMGTLKDSYDSRYWGLVRPDQVVGKGLAVWGR